MTTVAHACATLDQFTDQRVPALRDEGARRFGDKFHVSVDEKIRCESCGAKWRVTGYIGPQSLNLRGDHG